MSCDSVSKLIPLYFYGEVTPEEEDQVDQHVHECAACAAELEQQRTMAAALDRRQAVIPPALLEECREDLMAAIAGGAPRQSKPAKGPWTLFLEAMSDTVAVPKAKTVAKTERPRLHKVILFNDDYTPREFVVTVLKTEFRLGEGRAQAVMITAHRLGACVVAVYARDVAETKAARATEAGAAKGYPLRFDCEPEE